MRQFPDIDRLKGKNRLEYQNYLLPLLNLSEKYVYVHDDDNVSFGIYRRYIDEAPKVILLWYAAKQANIGQRLSISMHRSWRITMILGIVSSMIK